MHAAAKWTALRRRGGLLAVTAVCLAFGAPVWAQLPQAHALRYGSATVSVDGQTMTIEQTTPVAKLDWQRFNIGKDDLVQIRQPTKDSVIVIRVPTLNSPESRMQIEGQVISNGRIYFVNPNGIRFEATSHVMVGGLVAAGMYLDDWEMTRPEPPGKLRAVFQRPVENHGMIVARDLVSLVSSDAVHQAGHIVAFSGRVELIQGWDAIFLNGDGTARDVDIGRTLPGVMKHSGTTTLPRGKVSVMTSGRDVQIGGRFVLFDGQLDMRMSAPPKFDAAVRGAKDIRMITPRPVPPWHFGHEPFGVSSLEAWRWEGTTVRLVGRKTDGRPDELILLPSNRRKTSEW